MSLALRQKNHVQSRILSTPLLAYGVALIGGIFYLLRSWEFAHSQTSVLDEGAYLVKGYLFAIGRYWPYQDYGFWSNHMPLGFLIPGYVQAWFGPGLRTGRYFLIFLGLLFLLGLWIVTRRFGGRWWAAAAIWAVALNTALVKIYSQAVSEGLIACMLVWALVLTLGADRPTWQVLLGSLLAGVMAMTRLNLVPAVPVFLAYVFWQHGRRIGILASLASLGLILAIHLIYWPGILRLWATWIPTGLVPYLNRFRPPEAAPLWSPRIGLEQRVLSLFLGIRFHFIAAVGVLATLFLWPKRQEWKSESHFKASVFLTVLFIMLFALHAWASIGQNPQATDVMGKDYCAFCLPLYMGFFAVVGLILLAASAGSWKVQMNGFIQPIVALVIIIISTGVGFSAFEELDELLLPLLDTRVPRIQSLGQKPEWVRIKKILRENMELPPKEFDYRLRRELPALAGLLVGILILMFALVAFLLFRKTGWFPGASFGSLALVFFLLAGFFLAPSLVLGGGYQNYDCSGNVIQRYEQVGSYLRQTIPAGSTVFWNGGDSAVPLLYLKTPEIFPPLINSDYTRRLDGDSDELARYGFWNEDLANKWAAQSDFILVEQSRYDDFSASLIEKNGFEQVTTTPSILPCQPDARILVFKK